MIVRDEEKNLFLEMDVRGRRLMALLGYETVADIDLNEVVNSRILGVGKKVKLHICDYVIQRRG